MMIQKNLTTLGLCATLAFVAQAQDAEVDTAEDIQNGVQAAMQALQEVSPGLVFAEDMSYVEFPVEVLIDEVMPLEIILGTYDNQRLHETMLVTDVVPSHLHTALLLLGAEQGHPMDYEPVDIDENGHAVSWRVIPATGQVLEIFIVLPAEETEVTAAEEDAAAIEEVLVPFTDWIQVYDKEGGRTPINRWLFTGSVIIDDRNGDPVYVADHEGMLISAVSFGCDLIVLADEQRTDQASDNMSEVVPNADVILPSESAAVLRFVMTNEVVTEFEEDAAEEPVSEALQTGEAAEAEGSNPAIEQSQE